MTRAQLAIVCAIPVFLILFIQIAYRKHNQPNDISGCYRASDAVFEVRNGSLLAEGKPVATARLQYIKQQPYLAIDPGIDVSVSSVRIIPKEQGFAENYPMTIKLGQMDVSIVSTDNLKRIFSRQSCAYR